MHIGFDCTPLLGQRSGVGYYTGRLLEQLIQLNSHWQFSLYSNRPLSDPPPGESTRPITQYFPPSRWVWMQFVLPRLLQQHAPDLCHFPNNSAPLISDVPYAVTIHDASLFLHRQYHPWTRLLALRLLLPRVARRAAAVITVSHHARRELIDVLHLPPEKVHVIYEAAPSDFRPVTEPSEQANLQKRYHLPDQFILYVGTIEPRKNLLRLIEAVARVQHQVQQVPLLLVGPMGWMMADRIAQESERLGISDKVCYLGYVPLADLPGLYSMATVFAFPSLHEGFGLPPLEAMACGTAVLTSRGSAMAEICADAAYLVDPYDVREMADGLACLLRDSHFRTELQERGQKRAAQFSWRRAARETAVIYQTVIDRSHPPA